MFTFNNDNPNLTIAEKEQLLKLKLEAKKKEDLKDQLVMIGKSANFVDPSGNAIVDPSRTRNNRK